MLQNKKGCVLRNNPVLFADKNINWDLKMHKIDNFVDF